MVEAAVLVSALVLGGLYDENPAPAESYVFAQTNRVDVGGGATRVSAETNVPAPRRGYFPLRVFIDNSLGPRQTVKITYSASSFSSPISKSVEVVEGERRTVILPVPYLFRYGSLRVRGPGITQKGDQQVYFNTTPPSQRPVLSLGATEEFERWISLPPAHTTGDLNVFSMPIEEAPTELAAYVGYDAVVVPAAGLETLGEGARHALETYAATGGTLVLGKGGRGIGSALPLLRGTPTADQRYGFGRLVLCESQCTPLLGKMFAPHPPPVSPRGVLAAWQRNSYYSGNTPQPTVLLPQATAPIGRFLLIIALFTLAIGPGSIWVARRRGPAALLLTIPGTAFITCSAIIGYSLIQDGFQVHASTRGLTLLDSRQHRALTVGLTAYYANLAPSSARFSQSVAVIPPGEGNGEAYGPSIDWGDSATVGGDFVPSRTYREWGYISSEPVRARVVIKKQGSAWLVQNALGGKVSAMKFMADDALWSIEGLREGEEVLATKSGPGLPELAASAKDRFSLDLRDTMELPLKEGEFVARLEGQSFVPSGGLSLNHHDSEQLVRGEVER